MNNQDWPVWWINPLMAVDAEGWENPSVQIKPVTNCEHYSPDNGLILRIELAVIKVSESDAEKLSAWRGKQVALHDTHRRSFGYYELELVAGDAEQTRIVLRRGEPDNSVNA